MAFKLVNRYGNAIYHAETEAQKQELISRGFHEVPQDSQKTVTANTSAKRGRKNVKVEN